MPPSHSKNPESLHRFCFLPFPRQRSRCQGTLQLGHRLPSAGQVFAPLGLSPVATAPGRDGRSGRQIPPNPHPPPRAEDARQGGVGGGAAQAGLSWAAGIRWCAQDGRRAPDSLRYPRGCRQASPAPCHLQRGRGAPGGPLLGRGSSCGLSKQPMLISAGALGARCCHCLFISTSAPGGSARAELSNPPPDAFGGPRTWHRAWHVITTWAISKQQWKESGGRGVRDGREEQKRKRLRVSVSAEAQTISLGKTGIKSHRLEVWGLGDPSHTSSILPNVYAPRVTVIVIRMEGKDQEKRGDVSYS